MKSFGKLFLALSVGTLLLAAPFASADITLTDGNSVAKIDPTSSSGMYHWQVDAIPMLYQQWFWYRLDGDTREYSIDTISAPSITQSSNDHADVTYTAAGYTIKVSYTLNGGLNGSGSADMGEIITISNTGTNPLGIHFFQYSDFDLDGNPGNDSISSPAPGFVWDQTSGLNSLSETVVGPQADKSEAGIFANTLNELENGVVDDLNGNLTAGPGDVTWAWQWDRTGTGPKGAIAPGGSFQISKNKILTVHVPAPGAALLLGLGLGLVGWLKRRVA